VFGNGRPYAQAETEERLVARLGEGIWLDVMNSSLDMGILGKLPEDISEM